MEIVHYSLVCSSTDNADRFYIGCLEFKKTATKSLLSELSKIFFGLDQELIILNYARDNILFEIIIHEQQPKLNPIEHICLNVENKVELLMKIDALGLKIVQKQKGGKTIIFVSDFDGNLFEIIDATK